MNISSRCEYACRAVVELAWNNQNGTPLPSAHIAEQRAIPEKYLVHILLQLKRAGLVRSVRGAQGGYLLGRSPESITLHHIVEAIDGPVFQSLPVEDGHSSDLEPTWRSIADEMQGILKRITVQDILDRAGKANMYYI